MTTFGTVNALFAFFNAVRVFAYLDGPDVIDAPASNDDECGRADDHLLTRGLATTSSMAAPGTTRRPKSGLAATAAAFLLHTLPLSSAVSLIKGLRR